MLRRQESADNGPVDVVEDYRVEVVVTDRGWYAVALMDDGVEVLEEVEV